MTHIKEDISKKISAVFSLTSQLEGVFILAKSFSWRRFSALIAMLAVLPLAISCVSVESRFVFDPKGAGQLHLKYRLDASLIVLGRTISDQGVLLPITEQDFLDVVKEITGLELTNYRRIDDKEVTIISVTLNFDRVDLMSRVPGFPVSKLSFEENGTAIFELEISDDSYPVSGDGFSKVFDGLLGDHTVGFVVEAPRLILDSSQGILSENGRKLTLSIPLSDYIRGTNPQDLEVSW